MPSDASAIVLKTQHIPTHIHSQDPFETFLLHSTIYAPLFLQRTPLVALRCQNVALLHLTLFRSALPWRMLSEFNLCTACITNTTTRLFQWSNTHGHIYALAHACRGVSVRSYILAMSCLCACIKCLQQDFLTTHFPVHILRRRCCKVFIVSSSK